MATYATRRKRAASLRRIGFWATAWWGVSCGYFLLLVWQSRTNYVDESASTGSGFSFDAWMTALSSTFTGSTALRLLFASILMVWAAGAWWWLHELKHHKISYKVALKDLFLTIRK